MSDTSNTSDMRGRLGAILNAAAAAATPAGQALRTKGVAKMQALCPAECDYVRRGFWRDMRIAIPDLPDGDRVATLHATPPGGKGKKYYPKPPRGLFQSMGVATMAFAIEARHMTLRAWRALFGLASDAMVLSYDAVSAVSPEWQRDFARRCYQGLCSFWLHQDQNREVYTGVAEWVQGVLYITGTGKYGLRTQVWGPKDGREERRWVVGGGAGSGSWNLTVLRLEVSPLGRRQRILTVLCALLRRCCQKESRAISWVSEHREISSEAWRLESTCSIA